MKIHSSSLAFIPSDNKANRKSSQSKKKSTKQPVENSSIDSPVLVLPAPQDSDFEPLFSDDIHSQQNSRINRRTADAINAYIQESIQLLKSKHPELVSTIDYFV